MAPTVRFLPAGDHDNRLRLFRCGDIVDIVAVSTERYLVLVDTMVSPETMGNVVEMLRDEIGRNRPLLVVNTHGDWDHVWGNPLFIGENPPYPAPVIGHRLTGLAMTSRQAATILKRHQREDPETYANAAFVPPTLQFDGTFHIDGGDLSLEMIHTPGHTPDHCAVWIPQIRTLLAGDAAELPMPLAPSAEALPALRASLLRMSALGAERVLYCHAPGVTSPDLIDHNRDYFDELERRCRLAEGLPRDGDDQSLTEVLGWPLEDALPPGYTIADVPQTDFYRRFHAAAIRAMAAWIAGPEGHREEH